MNIHATKNKEKTRKTTTFDVFERIALGMASLIIGVIYIAMIIPFCVIVIDLLLHIIYDTVMNDTPKLTYESILSFLFTSVTSFVYSLFVFVLDISKVIVIVIIIFSVFYIIGDIHIRITSILKRRTRFTLTLKKHKEILWFLLFMIVFALYKTFGPMILEVIL